MLLDALLIISFIYECYLSTCMGACVQALMCVSSYEVHFLSVNRAGQSIYEAYFPSVNRAGQSIYDVMKHSRGKSLTTVFYS